MHILHTACDPGKNASPDGVDRHCHRALPNDSDTATKSKSPLGLSGGKTTPDARNDQPFIRRLLANCDELANSDPIESPFADRDRRGKNIGGHLINCTGEISRSNAVQKTFGNSTADSAPASHGENGFAATGVTGAPRRRGSLLSHAEKALNPLARNIKQMRFRQGKAAILRCATGPFESLCGEC